MLDTVQIVLISVIIIFAVLFVVLGVQVLLILKDLRVTVKKTNRLLDSLDTLTESISEPASFLSGLFFSSKTLTAIAKFFTSKTKNKEE